MIETSVIEKIEDLIVEYEKLTEEKPYVMLINPKAYMELRDYLKGSTIYNEPSLEIKYLFGVPLEISKYIDTEIIAMNEKDYHKYCEYRFLLEKDLIDLTKEFGNE